MAIPVSIEITSSPVAPGSPSALEIDAGSPVNTPGGETYTLVVDDPNNVVQEGIPVSITILQGASSTRVPIPTNTGASGQATFSIQNQRGSAELQVGGTS